MNLLDFLYIFLLVIFVGGLGLLTYIHDQNYGMLEDFCDDEGWTYSNGACHKIEGATYIERGIIRKNGKVYWRQDE